MNERYDNFRRRLSEIESSSGSLYDWADTHLRMGFSRDEKAGGWWFREWLPEAREVYLFGDLNGWNRRSLPLSEGPDGIWSIFLWDGDPALELRHGGRIKMLVRGRNGWRERIPSHIRRAVQDDATGDYAGQFWDPEPFDWTGDDFDPASSRPLLIYEAHVGMAQEEERVGTYAEFASNVLPRIASGGYTAVQLMGIAEHPYYGSYGYHVSNFFAPSSRFGTPEDLKALVKRAHELGLAVIMDLVHSHYVKNLNEGLNELDGSDHLYSPAGPEGDHPYWDSKLFDYGKPQVVRFLLSDIRYWMEEFRFDGFRFDGVTSMLYRHHGYTVFGPREKYFGPDVNRDALAYLTLANRLVHDIRPTAVTIAEDVSGMPALCSPTDWGGVGFDYRLAMAVPDFWTRLLKEVPDEQWDIWEIWRVLTDRVPGVGTVSYAESHDQALVGDKTIAFRLMDKEMYCGMERNSRSVVVERGMALHKMIRLATVSLGGQAYMSFMGNEFGHPEWIDFPREGNGWSYRYARRQWSLADNPRLRYGQLREFDRAMLDMVRRFGVLGDEYPSRLAMDEPGRTMVFARSGLLFVFCWHPWESRADYAIPVPEAGVYRLVMSTDEKAFGGQGRDDPATRHFSFPAMDGEGAERHYIMIYDISRSAAVFRREE